jgi:endoplasmic reticulum chaperone BiP
MYVHFVLCVYNFSEFFYFLLKFPSYSQGILEVSALDKGTGKSERITITAEKGRLSEEEIERLVEEAKEYAEEDRMLKDRIESRNGLESYLYSLKNALDEENVSERVAPEDKKEVMDLVEETLDWIDENPEAPKEEHNDRKKTIEQIANPLMRQIYDGRYSGAAEEDEEFYDADL